jgi:hypothetical protein
MRKRVLILTASTFILACGAAAGSAQESPRGLVILPPDQQQTQQQPTGQMSQDTTGQGVMTDHGMMGQGGMMGHGMVAQRGIMAPFMMRMIFSLMDSDGDGTVSLQEFQTAHERGFKAIDANKDGHLTLEEMQAFMPGTRTSAPPP